MLLRKIIFILILLPIANVMAQEATFQSFLKGFKECSKIESKSFEDSRPSDSAYIDKELCKQYFPVVNKDSTEVGSIWLKGSYIKHGNLIIAMFKRWCQDYDDKFNDLFVEYSVDLYTLIVFSDKGEVLNSRTIGYDGGGSYGTTYFARITPSDDPLKFRVEQATLDGDGKLMLQYKEDLVYRSHARIHHKPGGKDFRQGPRHEKGTPQAEGSRQPQHKIVRTVQVVFREMRKTLRA